MTSSIDIENYLKDQRGFLGCFACNDLPPFPKKFPVSMIINTHRKNQPGEHWLALVLTKSKCLYFDSFGVGITEETIVSYLQQKYEKATVNNECIQHLYSESCGLFCIAFIKNVKNNASFETFISNFNLLDLLENDNIVLNLI